MAWAGSGPHRQSRRGRCPGLASGPVAILLLLPLHSAAELARMLLVCVSLVALFLFEKAGPEMWVSWGMVITVGPGLGRRALPPAPALARAGAAAILRGWHLRSYVDGIPGCLGARGWLTLTKVTQPRRRRRMPRPRPRKHAGLCCCG